MRGVAISLGQRTPPRERDRRVPCALRDDKLVRVSVIHLLYRDPRESQDVPMRNRRNRAG